MAFVLYDFRHTFATRAAEAGMPVATLASILGHGDLRSVTKYVHVRQEAQTGPWKPSIRLKTFPRRNVRPVSVRSKALKSGITRDRAGCSGKAK